MHPNLKKNFRIALASAGISAAEWGRRNNVSRTAVCLLLSGKMTSHKLLLAARRFIDAEQKKMKKDALNCWK